MPETSESLWQRLEKLVETNKVPIGVLLVGFILVGFAAFSWKNDGLGQDNSIEVLDSVTEDVDQEKELVVEIAGAVEKPGVYQLVSGARINDLLLAAGGFSEDTDASWVEKTINRAAKLSDGQKLYIKSVNDNSDQQSEVLGANENQEYQTISAGNSAVIDGKTNINTASQKQLEDLPGIGPVYASNIIEHRPYSSIEELVSSGAIKQYVLEKIKDLVVVY